MREFTVYLIRYGMYAIYAIIIFIIIKRLLSSSIKQYHSNWNTLIDDFNFSTNDFYKLLREELNKTKVEGLSIEIVHHKEGNALSIKRRYLRVSWKDYDYDICGFPFGKGFFISWWLLYKNSLGMLLISKIPFIGDWLTKKLFPITYYKIDTASIFMTYAQSAVLKVIDTITNDKGIRALTENERKPILNNIFRR